MTEKSYIGQFSSPKDVLICSIEGRLVPGFSSDWIWMLLSSYLTLDYIYEDAIFQKMTIIGPVSGQNITLWGKSNAYNCGTCCPQSLQVSPIPWHRSRLGPRMLIFTQHCSPHTHLTFIHALSHLLYSLRARRKQALGQNLVLQVQSSAQEARQPSDLQNCKTVHVAYTRGVLG